jgi:CheY-like chemotaxis protein
MSESTHPADLEAETTRRIDDIGRLAAGLAHDFNNVLAVVLGRAELLVQEAPSGSRTREHLDEMIKACDRGVELTQQLLSFVRPEEARPEPVQVDEVLRGMDRMLRRVIGDDVQLVTRSAGATPSVSVDRRRLEQAVVNLVINAREAMPAGGRLTLATTTAEGDEGSTWPPPGRHVVLTIADTGVGMDADTRARAREPFFTTKQRGKGLGLCLVWRTIAQAGGRMRIESERGRGSTIELYLPVRADSTSTPVGAAAGAGVDARWPTGTERILLLENDDLRRRTMSGLLSRLGYDVLAASSADEAATLVAEGAPDLIMLDAVAGFARGEVARRLHALAPHAPLLVTAGRDEGDGPVHDDLLARTTLIPKPVAPTRLVQTVRQVLDER